MEYTEQNPLRLIELFAGIGSQTQALTNIGVPHKVVAISEIDKNALASYRALHGDVLNLGDIRDIPVLPAADLVTYSFPCQDISVAGRGAGIKEGTRSGLLFEVERLLKIAEERGTLPKYLLLENVKNLVSKKFIADFDRWLSFLSDLGYTNYWQVLNAKDYGIPQNRERVFCVSIRGEHPPFHFPKKMPLVKRLKDMIDKVVDERYYLKESTIRSIVTSNYNSRRDSIRPEGGIANTICARDFKGPQCVQIGELVGGKWDKMQEMSRRVYAPEGLSPTVHCAGGGNTELKIATEADQADCPPPAPEEPIIAAMRGRNPENPSDRTAGIPLKQRLEPNQQGVCNALTTVQKDNLLIEQGYIARRYEEFIKEHGYVPELFVAYNKQEVKDIAPTITGQCASSSGSSAVLKMDSPVAHAVRVGGRGCVDRHAWDTIMVEAPPSEEGKVRVRVATKLGYEEATEGDYVNISYPSSKTKRGRVGKGVAHTLTCGDGNAVVTENIRIRKLTPRECLRLMGWNDAQIDKIDAARVSGTQQYRQAGNGIVVQVLEAIFKALFFGEE